MEIQIKTIMQKGWFNCRQIFLTFWASPYEDVGALRYGARCRSVLSDCLSLYSKLPTDSPSLHIADAEERSTKNLKKYADYYQLMNLTINTNPDITPSPHQRCEGVTSESEEVRQDRANSEHRNVATPGFARGDAQISIAEKLLNLSHQIIHMPRKLGMRLALISLLFMTTGGLFAQEEVDLNPNENSNHTIMVVARTFGEEIRLRWAPTSSRAWRLGNTRGYRVMRYTLLRDNQLVDEQELSRGYEPAGGVLTPWRDTSKWEELALRDSFAAVAAQTIIGESFELTSSGEGVERMYNMVNEQESRYSFALFAADHSFEASRAMGLGLVDKEVHPNETYLYRVFIDYGEVGEEADTNRMNIGFAVDTGYISIGASDVYLMPKVQEVLAEFGDRQALISWNKEVFQSFFVSYVIERSEDGRLWIPRTTSPFVALDGAEVEGERGYMIDTFPHNGRPYFYRVIGRTIFDDYGIPSDPVQGIGVPGETAAFPYITGVLSDTEGGFMVSWDYDSVDEEEILGFRIHRTFKESGIQMTLTGDTLLSPTDRLFLDPNPGAINYYTVVAIDQYGREKASFPTLAMINDNTPPQPPRNIGGAILKDGKMIVTWAHNEEPDLLGYRVFMAYHPEDEFRQLTNTICYENYYIDSTNLNTLSQFIYIKLTAIDNNLNSSPMSDFGVLTLPDTIPPAPPAIKDASSSGEGVYLQWANSKSIDIARHEIYRRANDEEEWKVINLVEGKVEEDISEFLDTSGEKGIVYHYQVVATDYAGLSSSSDMVKLGKIDDFVRTGFKDLSYSIDRREKSILLTWQYESPDKLLNYEIYRIHDGTDKVYIGNLSPYDLLDTEQGRSAGKSGSYRYAWKDMRLNMNTTYEYEIKCLWIDGGRTPNNKTATIEY